MNLNFSKEIDSFIASLWELTQHYARPVVAALIARGGKISLQFSAIVGIKPLGYVTPDSREQTRANAMPRAPRARRRRILFLGEWARYRTECLSPFSI